MADAIWNNNYLLSNLDAQKLYAQSPLTTGVSGTSAYIGIEPSARYNETVLYSGALTSTVNFPEPMSSFNSVKIFISPEGNDKAYGTVYEIDPVGGTIWDAPIGHGFSNAWISIIRLTRANDYNSISADTKKSIMFGGYQNTSTTLSATTANNPNVIYKIVGINRKEV